MGKQALVINFDCIITEDNKVIYLESGPGLMRVGYHIDEAIKNRNTTREKIILSLLEFYGHVYIVYPEKFNIYEGMGISKNFIAENRDKILLYPLEEIITKKDSLKADGVIIADTEIIPLGQPFHYSAILRSHNISLPVVNDFSLYKAFTEKAQMGYIFSQTSPHAVPNQIVVDYDNIQACKNTVNQFKSEYVILKPIDGTRAQGIVIVPKNRLMEILAWLADQSPFKLTVMPKFSDSEIATRLRELDAQADKNHLRMCIAQEYVHPAEIKVNEVTFRPTIRIVIVACFDTETKMLTIQVPEVFYKLPTTPILNPNKLLWDETISYHELNRQVDLKNKDLFWRISEETRLAKQGPKPKYPYVVLIPDTLQKIIKEDIVQSLTPVCAYLFSTKTKDYYNEILNLNNSLDNLMRQALQLSIHRDLNEKICDFFANKNLNVVVILLYHLKNIINIYKHVGQLNLFSPDLAKLLLKYQICFGEKNTKEMGSIELLAQYILNEETLLPKIFNKQDYKSIKNILTLYSQQKFDFLIAENNYSQGINEFKAGKYSEATQLLMTASKQYLESSKEQATCFYCLVSCYIKQEKYDKAVKMAEEMVKLRISLVASKTIPNDDLERAQTKLNDVNNLLKADEIAFSALAAFKKENFTAAKNDFENAIGMHSKIQEKSARLATYHYNLASVYDRLNMLNKATEHCKICYMMRVELLGSQNGPTISAQEKLEKLQAKLSELNEDQRISPINN